MTLFAPSHEEKVGARVALSPETIYHAIINEPSSRTRAEPFTSHVLACALTVGLTEARENSRSLSSVLGLDRAALDALTIQWAPGARRLFSIDDAPERVFLDEEETQLHALLSRFKADASPLCAWIVSIVARRAMSQRHLWQDLGLLGRGELTRLMKERFPALAAANVENMKWKKFFYRQLCALEGFSLCAAPTCRECEDFDNCFGVEDGASVLARLIRP